MCGEDIKSGNEYLNQIPEVIKKHLKHYDRDNETYRQYYEENSR